MCLTTYFTICIPDVQYHGPSPDVYLGACSNLLSIGTSDKNVSITICDDSTTMWQLPIIIVTSTMVLLLGLSCGPIYLLHRILDPVKLLKLSRCCIPARCFDSIWHGGQKPLLGPVLHFVLNPCKQTFDETNERLVDKSGNDLTHWSIKNGYHSIIHTMLGPDINKKVTLDLMKKAIMFGDAATIKSLLANAQKQYSKLLRKMKCINYRCM